MKINLKATTMVKPSTATPSTTLWISNLDATMPENYHVLTLYFYRSTGRAGFFDTAAVMSALSRALVEFYPEAGRLKKNGDRIEIECNGEGALFVEAEADGEMDELGDFAPMAELSLIPAVDYSKGVSTYPILLCQATRFKCGGVCLGIAMEHHVADGFSAVHFINAWSEIARGHGITTPPFLDRCILSARKPPQPRFTHVEHHPPPPLERPRDNPDTSETLIFSIFKLTREQLSALKTNFQEDGGNKKINYSTYETLAGHVWRCVTKARGLPEDQETKLYIPVDGRFRLRPPLPEGYFGNVIFTAAPIALCGELVSNPLRFSVQKVHEALARLDDEYLRSALDNLEVQADLDTLPRGASPFKSPNLGIISWARLPLYEADFGWGKPIHVGLGTPTTEGKVVVLPSPATDASLSYAISLPKEQMQVFEKLFYDI